MKSKEEVVMITGLLIILLLVFILPFTVKFVEHNLEYFLFIMGLAAIVIAGVFSPDLILEILENPLLYYITAAVLIAGLLFKLLVFKMRKAVHVTLKHIPFGVFVFCVVVILGLLSSLITAIIASLVLVEIIHALTIKHTEKIKFAVVACFSIGLGAAMTPIGEPLSTIVVSRLDVDFWYLADKLGPYIIPGVLLLGIFGAFFIKYEKIKGLKTGLAEEKEFLQEEETELQKEEKIHEVFVRAFKIFVFIFALEMLGSGFKPLIDSYVVQLNSMLLFWINMVSAILDNATLAAAEISPSMSAIQVKSILMGLLISGGMLIPGNIPNIVSAGKLKIKSREWAVIGVPIGLVLMAAYFVIIFII